MKFTILAVGNKLPNWVTEGYNTFIKRMPANYALQVQEITPAKRTKHYNPQKIIEQEGCEIIKNIPGNSMVIALDVDGNLCSSQQLSQKLENWQLSHSHLVFLIGGADGLSSQCLQHAHYRWSLSPLTLPHALARILVAEQLYRAVSILSNHPYHK